MRYLAIPVAIVALLLAAGGLLLLGAVVAVALQKPQLDLISLVISAALLGGSVFLFRWAWRRWRTSE